MIYDYKVKDTNGETTSLDNYKGKVLLVVNTATGCGFTPQYEGLQKLYDKYKDKGFEVLDFPCNQFFEQAPGSDEEIKNFCTTNYGTTFKRFSKIDVNGEGADPVYKYLRGQAPSATEDEKSQELYEFLSSKGFNTSGDDIKWNFTKFLIDKDGNVIKRFAPTDDPEKIETEIEILKGKNNITVSAVDTSNNTTTEVKEYNGLTKPEVKLTLSSDKTKVNVSISHENGLKGVSGSLNGQDFNVDGVTEGTTSLNFDLNLVEGANKVKVVATSTDGTETIAEQEFTYGTETTENPTNTTENNTTDTGNDNQDKPKISAEQKADDKKKIVVDMKYEKGIKSATLQFNGQNYDINIAENTKEGNFELDLAEGENKVILTVVGSDGATQVLEKSFTVQ